MSDSLLHRIDAGDPSALEAFLDRYGALVWGLACRFSYDQSDAQDAAQDALLAIWRSAARFDPSRSSEETFVAMMARRKLIERMRMQARSTPPNPAPNEVGMPASALAQHSEDVSRAGQILADLRPDELRVLRMSVLQGLTHAEISARIGMPVGTVKTHVRRSLARVRDALLGRPQPIVPRKQLA